MAALAALALQMQMEPTDQILYLAPLQVRVAAVAVRSNLDHKPGKTVALAAAVAGIAAPQEQAIHLQRHRRKDHMVVQVLQHLAVVVVVVALLRLAQQVRLQVLETVVQAQPRQLADRPLLMLVAAVEVVEQTLRTT